jgi:putative endonuclease
MPHGELDIVALDGEVLVFVEVKYRRSGRAEEAVGATKMRNLQRAAEAYRVEMNEVERAVRYDLIAIDADGLRHHENIAGY